MIDDHDYVASVVGQFAVVFEMNGSMHDISLCGNTVVKRAAAALQAASMVSSACACSCSLSLETLCREMSALGLEPTWRLLLSFEDIIVCSRKTSFAVSRLFCSHSSHSPDVSHRGRDSQLQGSQQPQPQPQPQPQQQLPTPHSITKKNGNSQVKCRSAVGSRRLIEPSYITGKALPGWCPAPAAAIGQYQRSWTPWCTCTIL